MKKIALKTIVILFVGFSGSNYAQWFAQNNPLQNSYLSDIIALDENTAIAVGGYTYPNPISQGIIIKTTDGGENWVNTLIDTLSYCSSVCFLNADTGYVGGGNYYWFQGNIKILKTTDAGDNWIIDSGGDGVASTIHFVDQNNGWTIGSYYDGETHVGTNYKTTDGGINWIPQDPLGYLLTDIYFVNIDTGWAVGFGILKTTNGGDTWVYYNTGNTSLYSIHFIDEFTGWVGGRDVITNQGKIFKTIDGGENWVSQPVGVNIALNDIYFASENTGWSVGSDGIILNTIDGGLNWIIQPSGSSNDLYSVHFADENTGWAVGENGTILKTTNGGGTIPVELTSFTATAQNNYVELNWKTATELNNLGFEVQRSTSNSEFVTVGFVEGNGTTTEVHQYSFRDKDVSGSLRYRLKQVDFDGSFEYSDIVEVEVLGNISYRLAQNYPNPFNPTTTLSFVISHSSFVSLKVYDVLGNEIEALVNSEKPAGNFEITWNAESIPSGVYFYTLQAGNFTETRKMLLMK